MMNMYEMSQAFKKLDALNEEVFDVSRNGMEEMDDYLNAEEEEDKTIVIDPEAETEDDLKDSYDGMVILRCRCCSQNIYKAPEDVMIDEETGWANVDEECPNCASYTGYSIMGMVKAFDEDESESDTATNDENAEKEESGETVEVDLTASPSEIADAINSILEQNPEVGELIEVAETDEGEEDEAEEDDEKTEVTVDLSDDEEEDEEVDEDEAEEDDDTETEGDEKRTTRKRATRKEVEERLTRNRAITERRGNRMITFGDKKTVNEGSARLSYRRASSSHPVSRVNEGARVSRPMTREHRLSREQIAERLDRREGAIRNSDRPVLEHRNTAGGNITQRPASRISESQRRNYNRVAPRHVYEGKVYTPRKHTLTEAELSRLNARIDRMKREERLHAINEGARKPVCRGQIRYSRPISEGNISRRNYVNTRARNGRGLRESEIEVTPNTEFGDYFESVYPDVDETVGHNTIKTIWNALKSGKNVYAYLAMDPNNKKALKDAALKAISKAYNKPYDELEKLWVELVATPDMKFKEYYRRYNPGDTIWKEINPNVTIKDLWDNLRNNWHSVYDDVPDDSEVRDVAVGAIAEAYGIDYDRVYDTWIRNDESFPTLYAYESHRPARPRRPISEARRIRRKYNEDFNKLTIEGDSGITEITQGENGKVDISIDPSSSYRGYDETSDFENEYEDEESEGEDKIVPIDDETMEKIESNGEEEGTDVDIAETEPEFDDVNAEDFEELGEAYLKKVYDNVKDYRLKGCYKDRETGNLRLEGVATLKNGKKKTTNFVFESITQRGNTVCLSGYNTDASKKPDAFRLTGTIRHKSLFSESLHYNYSGINTKTKKSQRVCGTIRKN